MVALTVVSPSITLINLDGPITNAPTYTTNGTYGVTNVVNNALTNIPTISRWSLDGANWINWRTNYPNNTNGIPTTVQLSGNLPPLYFDVVKVTPNPLTAGTLK